jgi:hypothetical protein
MFLMFRSMRRRTVNIFADFSSEKTKVDNDTSELALVTYLYRPYFVSSISLRNSSNSLFSLGTSLTKD